MTRPVRLVTGYVPLYGHPRNGLYEALGERLKHCWPADQTDVYRTPLRDLWAYPIARACEPYTADNPAKNTRGYHAVQLQKTQWLEWSARAHPDAVLCWVDFGVLHLPDVTVADVAGALLRAGSCASVTMPGCWPPGPVRMDRPCWRFCGGFVVCPAWLAAPLHAAVQDQVMLHAIKAQRISWEVNYWALTEEHSPVSWEWYQSDHNASMLRNLKTGAKR